MKITSSLAPDVARALKAQKAAVLRAINSHDGIDYSEPAVEEEEDDWTVSSRYAELYRGLGMIPQTPLGVG